MTILKIFTKYVDEMIANGIDTSAYAFTLGKVVVKVLIKLAYGDNIDILLAVHGYSNKREKVISRVFAYQMGRPFSSAWIEPEDYVALVDLLQPRCCGTEASRDRIAEVEEWKPFNLFALLESYLPAHPSAGEAARKAVDDFNRDIRTSVEDADKVYFHSFCCHINDGRHVTAANLAKTLVFGNYAAYRFCADHNVSTCWTSYPELARDIDTAINYINGN